ncbi:MAG: HAMP domain-containing histidine kinase [Sphingobium sp.]|nr:HAMP domain-containing histidine kinase [Sphingobium sp.]
MPFRRHNKEGRVSAPGLWSTASLRLALAFSVIFGLGSAILIIGVDYGLLRFAEDEVRHDLNHQMEVMRDGVARVGPEGLIRRLEAQRRNRDARRYLFLVVTPQGHSFSNGLTRAAVNDEGFRQNIGTTKRPTRFPDQKPNMLVLSQTLQDGTLLAIGRDTQHLDELRGGIRAFALWSGVGIIVFAIIAGLAIGYVFLGRLQMVNRSVERIISGKISERLPPIGFGREFDDLARNLNLMLERQEATMGALETVSEGIAHDLRTPLSRLRNRMDELQAAADNPEKRQAAIDYAVQEMEQISALFESLLVLARVEGGQTENKGVPVDLAMLVEEVGEAYRPVLEDAGGVLRLLPAQGGDSDSLMVKGDASLLMQALSNLIENALVHAVGQPDISVMVQQDDGYMLLSVADRGPGIPAEERGNVLRRFYRMDRSRSRPGSGLGLAMCAAVAKWHGGELMLRDNQPGLRVEMKLPALRRGADDAASASAVGNG